MTVALDMDALAEVKRAHRSSTERRMMWRAFLFVAPACLLLAAIYAIPILVLAVFSVTDYQLGALSIRFIGLDNFVHAFNDPVFLRSLKNTVIYAVIVIPLGVFLALGVALLVYNRKRSRAFWEAAYFLPVTATLVAMATVWRWPPDRDAIGSRTEGMRAASSGFEPVSFLSNPVLLIPTMAMIGVWQVLGFNMVLFLAGLTAIPKDLYEAARLDGAKSPIDRFLTVTWPMLGPTTLFVVVTTSISAFKVFETVAVLTKGRFGSETLLFDLYLEGFEYSNTGYAAALTLIFLVIILILSIGQTVHLDRKVHY